MDGIIPHGIYIVKDENSPDDLLLGELKRLHPGANRVQSTQKRGFLDGGDRVRGAPYQPPRQSIYATSKLVNSIDQYSLV